MWVKTKPTPRELTVKLGNQANPTTMQLGTSQLINADHAYFRHVDLSDSPYVKSSVFTIFYPDVVADETKREATQRAQVTKAFAYLQYNLGRDGLITNPSPAVLDMNGDLTIPTDAGN